MTELQIILLKLSTHVARALLLLFTANMDASTNLYYCHALQVRLNKWLTELEQMFYGMAFAFDKSLRGEGDLKAALLKNIYSEDTSKQRSADLLARYITRYSARPLSQL